MHIEIGERAECITATARRLRCDQRYGIPAGLGTLIALILAPWPTDPHRAHWYRTC